MRTRAAVACLAALVPLAACEADPRSSSGFALPPGDAARGQAAFVDLRCNACHRVSGTDMPSPEPGAPKPRGPVPLLGGEVPHARTDGELVTAIIYPTHELAASVREELRRKGAGSEMPDYASVLTVRQLADLVAFLQSRYTVVRPGR